MRKLFLGIDTSCYTTSAALVDTDRKVVGEARRLLRVPAGKRGLAQSEMVYQHMRNLPELLTELLPEARQDIAGIGVSERPRRRQDSYMPAFLAGLGYAEVLATALAVPLYRFTHQENHVLAAVREYPELWGCDLYMLHLSGGTTDWLQVNWEHDSLAVRELATSVDISAGQLIDRIGVLLGLPFPAGPGLEALALQAPLGTYRLPLPRDPERISFAGAETQARRDLLAGKCTPAELAGAVLDIIRRSLRRTLQRRDWAADAPFLAVGGVMANQYLRTELASDVQVAGMTPYFAAARYSSDNATGNAYGAMEKTCRFNG
ncbi:MAG: glycoprotease [Veillonellaceae bacterium]|nr:glycoprotease [Veillonellaceae bacterium]